MTSRYGLFFAIALPHQAFHFKKPLLCGTQHSSTINLILYATFIPASRDCCIDTIRSRLAIAKKIVAKYLFETVHDCS